MNGASQKSMYIRRNRRASHIGDSDVVVIKIFEGGVRARRGTRAGVAATDARVLWDHLARARGRNGMRLGRGRGGGRGARTRTT